MKKIKFRMPIKMIVKDFSELNVTTITAMVYMNIELDLKKIFDRIKVFNVVESVPLLKKKKEPIINEIYVPYGNIFSLRWVIDGKVVFKGLVTKPILLEINNLKTKEKDGNLKEKDIDRMNKINANKKSRDFGNQITCIVSITKPDGEINNINIMIFKNKFKIVGCKNREMTFSILKILWRKIYSINAWSYNTSLNGISDFSQPEFVFDFVMTNYSTNFGIRIDKAKIDELFSRPEYSYFINNCYYNPEGNADVKIKLHTTNKGIKFPSFKFIDGIFFNYEELDTNIYKINKEIKPITFIIFASSKAKISGKNILDMKYIYNEIVKIISENQEFVKEKS